MMFNRCEECGAERIEVEPRHFNTCHKPDCSRAKAEIERRRAKWS